MATKALPEICENRYWLRIWTTVATAICAIAGMLFAYNAHQSYLTAQLVLKANANPIAARCAFVPNGYNDSMCLTFDMRLNGKP